jgi:hypothetical protein
MLTRNTLLSICLIAGSSAAVAEASCGLQAVNFLANGQTQELAALFADPAQVVEPLQKVAKALGKMTDIQEASTARDGRHLRISVQSKNLPTSYSYQGSWIRARSEALGELQFHMAQTQESTCRLLALHIDSGFDAP